MVHIEVKVFPGADEYEEYTISASAEEAVEAAKQVMMARTEILKEFSKEEVK